MKRKPKAPARDGPTSVARAAGCTKALAHRLLQRGMTRSEIIARVADQKARKAELLEFPATTVPATNGNAADGELVTFAKAQCEKENWLAALRRLEYQRKSGELMPTAYIRRWGLSFLTEARDVLLRGPSELADRLAAETDPLKCAAIVRGWVEMAMGRLYQCERLWGPEDDAA